MGFQLLEDGSSGRHAANHDASRELDIAIRRING